MFANFKAAEIIDLKYIVKGNIKLCSINLKKNENQKLFQCTFGMYIVNLKLDSIIF